MPLDVSHTATEAAIAAAILDPRLPTPDGLLGRDGGPVGRRFAVHRATTTFGLIGALSVRFPVLEAALGAETFADLAKAFLAVDRPRTALLLHWGDGLADFVEAQPDLADWPWLADLARLESAWARAHHAAEAEPIALADLAAIDPEHLAACRLHLHPSLETLASPHPVASIWSAHQGDAPALDAIAWRPESVVIVRPDADVVLHRTSPAGLAFVAALAAGDDVARAAEAALALDPGFDAGAHLVGVVDLGAVVDLLPPSSDPETDR